MKYPVLWLIALLLLMLSGCGQTGPLYLPDKDQTTKTSKSASATNP